MLPSVLSGSIMKLADHPSERMAERTNLPPEALAKLRALLGKTDSKHIPKGDQHLRMPDGSSAVLKDIGKRHVVATFYSRNMTPPGRDMRMSLSPRNTRPIFDKARKNKHRSAENASSYEHDLRRALSTGDSALVDQKAGEFLADAAIHAKNRVLSPLTTLRGSEMKRKTAEKKSYRRIIPEDAVVYSATPSAESALKYGLLSSRAIAKRPDLLAIARPDPKDRAEWLESYERHKRKASRGGPSFFFTKPDPDKISDKHYIKKWKLEELEVALGKLLKDHPKTRIYGSELVPLTKDAKVVRKKILTRREVLQYINTPSKELWKHHDDPEGRYYAANVPHGALLVPGGVVDPVYLKKTAGKKPYRHRAEVYIHDGKGNVLANKTDSGWQFPAGGIEGKDTPERTAKREVLEEAGYRIVNPRSFGAKPAPAKWPEWYRDIARAKGRDNYAGQVTHMLVAELGKKDKRLFDKEGDGLHSLQLVPLRQVIADHEMIVRDPKHSHHVFRKATLPGLKKLHKQLSGGQTR
jgi:8-oxo-dGTP pyrophosphatase MutT (NUDIX family)